MRVWLSLLVSLAMCACVGQKEDPEPFPGTDPESPVDVTGVTEGTRFFRRVLALEFTATWCQYCPNMHDAMSETLVERPGRFVTIAVHQYDEMTPAEADALVSLFQVSAFPSMVFDWDVSTMFNEQKSSRMVSYLDEVLKEETCGISIESSTESGEVKINVKTVEEGSYSVFAAVVEDGILTNQAGAGENYSCEAVLRYYLGKSFDNVEPEQWAADSEHETTFALDRPVTPKCRIVAYVMFNGKAINAATCPVDGIIDFVYEED